MIIKPEPSSTPAVSRLVQTAMSFDPPGSSVRDLQERDWLSRRRGASACVPDGLLQVPLGVVVLLSSCLSDVAHGRHQSRYMHTQDEDAGLTVVVLVA